MQALKTDSLEAGVYRHYKGGLYQVLGIGAHSETSELMVVYISLTGSELLGPRMRIRPLHGPSGWLTPVLRRCRTTAAEIQRFVYIGNSIKDE